MPDYSPLVAVTVVVLAATSLVHGITFLLLHHRIARLEHAADRHGRSGSVREADRGRGPDAAA